jgi:NAD(P)-dependent dehydrogenase (short-subunit alcohol dehydrogenase family)
MTTTPQRTAIVSGGNRGIGLELCRQLAQHGYRVILTSRNAENGERAAEALLRDGADVTAHTLDVGDPDSIRNLRDFVVEAFGAPDVLINNAAVLLDDERHVLAVEPDVFRETIETNVLGPLQLCQAFMPLMLARNYGRIVNVSSEMGRFEDMDAHTPAYRLSKAALNALTLMLAHAARGRNVLVNAVDPGWVHTDMGGPSATRSVAEGADTIVWLAMLPDDGPRGGLFLDRKPIAW